MKFAVFTVSTPDYAPEDLLPLLAELGYNGVEWRVAEPNYDANKAIDYWANNRCTVPVQGFADIARPLVAQATALGLETPTLGDYLKCDDLATVELLMTQAASVGIKQMRVGPLNYDGTVPARELFAQSRKAFEQVQALSKKTGVKAIVEMHMGIITASASAARALVEGLDPDCIGVLYDVGNMVYEGFEQYQLGLEIIGEYLAHVHLKNAMWQVAGTNKGAVKWQCNFAPLRTGQADCDAFIKALRTVGYDGWVSFEDFSAGDTRDKLVDNLAYIKSLR